MALGWNALLWLLYVLLLGSRRAPAFTWHSRHSANLIRRQSSPRDENTQAENLAKSQQEGWRDAKILVSRPACPSNKSTFMQLQVDDTTQSEYTVPGQFLQFRYQDEDPIFLAIASAPDADHFEFLIKMAPRLSWLSEALVEGNTVQVSRVMCVFVKQLLAYSSHRHNHTNYWPRRDTIS